jgi:hypothetical protein
MLHRCDACHFTLDKLQSYLESNSSLDAKVEEFLQNNFCTLLPTGAQELCNTTVSRETPAILSDIAAKFLNSTTDCVQLGLCHDSHRAQFNGGVCDLCQKIVAWVDGEWFNNPKAQGFVVQEIEAVCGLMPKSVQVPCDAAADQAAPALMKTIGDFLSAQGCLDIHLCN